MIGHGSYKLLAVKDNPGNFDIVRERPDNVPDFKYELVSVASLRDAIEVLANESFDAILLDLNLPDSTGIDTLRRLRAATKAGAVIVLSGQADDELRRLALREGALDFLEKNEPASRLLVRSLLYGLERHRAQSDERQLLRLISCTPDAIMVVSTDGIVRYANRAATELLGKNGEDLIGQLFGFSLSERSSAEIEIRHGQVRRIGEMRTVDFEWRGEPTILATIRDVTDRRMADDRLLKQTRILQSVLNGIGDGVVVADENGKFILFNPAGEKILHAVGTEEAPENWSKHFGLYLLDGETLCPSEELPLVRAIQGESVDQAELIVKRADLPEPVWLSVTARPLRDMEGTLRGGVTVFRDVTEKRRTDELLRLRDRAIQSVSSGVLITDPHLPDNPIVYASAGFERMTGYSQQDVVGKNCRFLQGKDTNPSAVAEIKRAIESAQPCLVVLLNYRKDGTSFWNELSVAPVTEADQRITHFVGVLTDVSQRLHLEHELRQAQKMEALGHLAGGIAHDINNSLTVINGYCELVMKKTTLDASTRESVAQILEAGNRSASLTRKLLIFSRKQIVAPQVLALNPLIREASKMLERLIGEDVSLKLSLQSRHDRISADAGLLEQVLMNLAVNAHDAMPTGGKLSIKTADIQLGGLYGDTYPTAIPGNYVLISVSDTGCGMSPEIRSHIFDPFFTTKEIGKGTGLGLAVVHGAVKQSRGHIEVESKVGIGTTFKIYLPSIEVGVPVTERAANAKDLPKGTETILLVEDEPGVRSLAKTILADCGYIILDAPNGTEALRIASDHRRPIDLLLTDVVMPELGGAQLGVRFLTHQPQAKVIYMSGYTDDAIMRHGILHDQAQFLQKPFTVHALASKIRDVLDGD